MAVQTGGQPRVGEEGLAVGAAAYERISLAESDVTWELWDGRLRGKPGMSVAHRRSISRLAKRFLAGLDEERFEVRINGGWLRRGDDRYYVPDLFVVAVADVAAADDRPGVLEAYAAPMRLVVEVWSPSTGRYDVNDKLAEYQGRGDREIWGVQPYERTLTIWRRQADGSYVRPVATGGSVEPVALPGVVVDFDRLFA